MIFAGWLAALALGAQEVPRTALDLRVNTLDGKGIAIAQYRGKALVVAFILTTCPHCQHTVGVLSRLQPRYEAKGLEMLAVAVNREAPGAIPAFIETVHPAFPVAYLTDANAVTGFCEIPPRHIPQMPIVLFIDREGTIRQQHEGSEPFFEDGRQEQHLSAAIEELLTPRAKTSAPAARH